MTHKKGPTQLLITEIFSTFLPSDLVKEAIAYCHFPFFFYDNAPPTRTDPDHSNSHLWASTDLDLTPGWSWFFRASLLSPDYSEGPVLITNSEFMTPQFLEVYNYRWLVGCLHLYRFRGSMKIQIGGRQEEWNGRVFFVPHWYPRKRLCISSPTGVEITGWVFSEKYHEKLKTREGVNQLINELGL